MIDGRREMLRTGQKGALSRGQRGQIGMIGGGRVTAERIDIRKKRAKKEQSGIR